MARNDHSGYPMKWFKDQNAVRHAWECAICLEVLKDAVQVRICGHQYCALCIDDILKTDPRCPSCRIEISNTMVFEDQAARRLIKQLPVNCCNEGCTWQGDLSSLLQSHQNNCNFLIHRDDNVHQSKVDELEQKHDTLMLQVLLLEQKHEQDIKELKLKHEQDIKELKLKHGDDIKELKLKHKQDIGDLQLKYEEEKKDIKELQLKHEQDFKELKLKLEQMEDLWQRLKEKEKELSEKEKLQNTSLKKSKNPWNRPKEKAKELSEEDKKTAFQKRKDHWKTWKRPEEKKKELSKEDRETAPSTAFDHWMQLNIPIPEDPKYLFVYVFFLDQEKQPLMTNLRVCQRTRCSDLLTQLSNFVDVPAHRFLLLRSQDSRICHIYDPIEEVSLSSDNEILVACEIMVPKQNVSSSSTKQESESSESNVTGNDKQYDYHVLHISVIQRLKYRVTGKCSYCGLENQALSYCSKCSKVAYCDRECQRNHWTSHRQYCDFQPLFIGTPFIISVDASEANLNNLKRKAFHYARYSVEPRNGKIESSRFNLTLLENLTDFRSKGKVLSGKEGDTPVVDENVCLALDWQANTQGRKLISKDLIVKDEVWQETIIRGIQ